MIAIFSIQEPLRLSRLKVMLVALWLWKFKRNYKLLYGYCRPGNA